MGYEEIVNYKKITHAFAQVIFYQVIEAFIQLLLP